MAIHPIPLFNKEGKSWLALIFLRYSASNLRGNATKNKYSYKGALLPLNNLNFLKINLALSNSLLPLELIG